MQLEDMSKLEAIFQKLKFPVLQKYLVDQKTTLKPEGKNKISSSKVRRCINSEVGCIFTPLLSWHIKLLEFCMHHVFLHSVI